MVILIFKKLFHILVMVYMTVILRDVNVSYTYTKSTCCLHVQTCNDHGHRTPVI